MLKSLKIDKKDSRFKELSEYVESTGLTLQEVLLSKEHEDKVSKMLYAVMPKLVRLAINEEKFKAFFLQNRASFVKSMLAKT